MLYMNKSIHNKERKKGVRNENKFDNKESVFCTFINLSVPSSSSFGHCDIFCSFLFLSFSLFFLYIRRIILLRKSHFPFSGEKNK